MVGDRQRWLGWRLSDRTVTVGDHLLSSASNWIILILAARWLTAREFAIFSGTQAGVLIILGAVRGLYFEPVLLQRDDGEGRRKAIAAVALVSLVCSLCAFLVLVGLGHMEWALVAAMLSGLIAEDGWRYLAFAERRACRAVVLDLVWAIAAPLLLLALAARPHFSAAEALLAWMAGAMIAALVGAAQVVRAGMWSQTSGRRPRGLPFALDFLLSSSLVHVSILIAGLVAPASIVGSARLGLSSAGILGVLRRGDLAHLSASMEVRATAPEMAHAARTAAVRAFARAAPWCLAASGLLWLGHERLIGREDLAFVTIFGFASVAMAVGIATNPLIVMLRLMDAGWTATRRRALMAPLVIGLPPVGAAILGAAGFGAGVLTSTVAVAALLWHAVGQRAMDDPVGKASDVQRGPAVPGSSSGAPR